MMRARLAIALAFAAAIALAGEASAQSGANIRSPKYDVRIEVLPDGSLDVTESVTLIVGAKPMSWFDRKIPKRRTDGFAGVVALLDGQRVPVTIDSRNDLKIRWDFSPTANATHTFEIRYRAVHVLAREIDGPRLVWTALPREHSYPIDSAKVSLFAPTGAIATYVGAHGGAVLPADPDRPGVVIGATSLEREDTVSIDITFAPNSIKPVEPQWYIEQQRQLDMLPAWIAGALCLLVVGAGILVMAFARLRQPAVNLNEVWSVPAAEGSASPAIVTLLLSRSQSNVLPAMRAAFFRLVRDGHLNVEKRAGKSRGAAFDVREGAGGGARSPHEEWIVDRVRRERDQPDLRRVMMRMSRRQREFRAALMAETASLGWIDAERSRARTWLLTTGIVLVASGVVGLGVTAAFAGRFGPAPVAIPVALVVIGLIYVIASAAMSVLSESGVREGARWRARVSELKSIITNGASGQSPLDFERWFPLAIGAGIGRRWLRAFEAVLTAGNPELGWLKLMGSPADAASSLGMMMAISHSSSSGGAGGGGGGAGGGSSGAG